MGLVLFFGAAFPLVVLLLFDFVVLVLSVVFVLVWS